MQDHIGKTPRWSGGRKVEDRRKERLGHAFIGVPWGKTRQNKVNSLGLASLNNYGGL